MLLMGKSAGQLRVVTVAGEELSGGCESQHGKT